MLLYSLRCCFNKKLMTWILNLPRGKLMYYWESLFLGCPTLLPPQTWEDWMKAKLLPCKAWTQERINNYCELTDIILYIPRHIMIPFWLLRTTSNHAFPSPLGKFHESKDTFPLWYHPNLTLCCELLSVYHLLCSRSNLHLNQCNDLFWDVEREAFT